MMPAGIRRVIGGLIVAGAIWPAVALGQFADPQTFPAPLSQSEAAAVPASEHQLPLPPSRERLPLSPKRETMHETRTAGSVWGTLTSLGLVLVLILAVARLWKKHGPAVNGGIPAEALQVLGKRHIDQRQTVYLLRLGRRILVVGSSAAGLQPLGEISDPVEVDYLAGLCRASDSASSAGMTFRKLFGSAAWPGDRTADAVPPATSAQERLVDRLRGGARNARETSLEVLHE